MAGLPEVASIAVSAGVVLRGRRRRGLRRRVLMAAAGSGDGTPLEDDIGAAVAGVSEGAADMVSAAAACCAETGNVGSNEGHLPQTTPVPPWPA